MNNILAGTPNEAASDLYPEQNLTTTPLHVRYAPTCTPPGLRHYYKGNDVGDFRMTGTQGYLPVPGEYVPQWKLQQVAACDIRQLPVERGMSWQSYNTSSTCGNRLG